MVITCSIVLSGFVLLSPCRAFESLGNWADSTPQIRVHDAFYPHAHMRDLKAAARRGKILVITLVISAGLMVLISTAILRSGKEKEEADTAQTVNPAELRARVIAAAAAGRNGLLEGREHALETSLYAYARACRIEWKCGPLEYSTSATCNIGGDSVTVVITDDGSAVEVRAIRGKMGASAVADAEGSSIRSSIFTLHALDRGANA
jgi:hypothetical protein